MDKTKTTIYLDEALRRKLKVFCAERDLSMTEVIEVALTKFIAEAIGNEK
jgi:predicted transcriptional regulator